MKKQYRQYNIGMLSPESLLEKIINIVDYRGRIVSECSLKNAKLLVGSGAYYVADTGHISFRD